MSGLSIVETGAAVQSGKCLRRVGLALSNVSQKRTAVRHLKQ